MMWGFIQSEAAMTTLIFCPPERDLMSVWEASSGSMPKSVVGVCGSWRIDENQVTPIPNDPGGPTDPRQHAQVKTGRQ
jgi:hypothetical protein